MSQEFVINQKTGEVRQAGSDGPGNFVIDFRKRCEINPYVLAKGVLGLSRLTTSLHLPVCNWLVTTPPYRHLMLLPRDHLKTSIMRTLAIHMLIQPEESNVWLPGKEGASFRILLAGETATNAEHQLSWVETQFAGNALLRALWPHRVWQGNRPKEARWNAKEMVLPRKEDYPEASIETIGVGGAVVGRHYDIMMKDDLVTFAAANSAIVMQEAINWHKTSRALFDHPDTGIEIMLGTRWAVGDLWQDIIDNDPSVEITIRAAIEDSKPIFPEIFSIDSLMRLQRELGPAMFALLYMNSAADPSLVDFDPADFRFFEQIGDMLRFDACERDRDLARLSTDDNDLTPLEAEWGKPTYPVGTRLSPEVMADVFGQTGVRSKLV